MQQVKAKPGDASKKVDWQQVGNDLAPIRTDLRPAVIKKKSRDYYWFSPILRDMLGEKLGDIVVEPENEDELLAIARYCVARRIPVTPRGGGTGNYGQAVPEYGGIILDLTRMKGIRMVRPGIVRAAAGERLYDVEKAAHATGWELRLSPSTWRTATAGGFVAGGTSGCGAMTFGTLHEQGNVLGARILTFGEEPEFVELRGADAQRVVHAYGTTGIVCEVELALTPMQPWRDAIVRFADTRSCINFGEELSRSGGIVAKQVTIVAWGQARYMPIGPLLQENCAYAPVIISDCSWESFLECAVRHGGTLVHDCPTGQMVPGIAKVNELGFGHTHFYALTKRPELAHLTPAFVGEQGWQSLMEMVERHDETAPIHIEYLRCNGDLQRHAAILFEYTTAQAMDAFTSQYEGRGVEFYSPHTPELVTGGMQPLNQEITAFKHKADPFGLLNPGKMPGWPLSDDAYLTPSE